MRRRDQWIVAACALLLSLLFLVKLWDPDVWWHLATGRLIAAEHAIPHVDPFSFTLAGAPWRAVDWLAELAMYGAWSLAGAAGLGALTVLAAFVLLFALGATLRVLEVRLPVVLATLTCTALLVQVRYSMARPMMLGAALLCVGLYLCARFWCGDERSQRTIWVVWIFPPLVFVWTAVHPTAVLGLAQVGALWLSSLLVRRERRSLGSSSLAFALTLVGFFASPAGRGLFATAAGVEGSPLTVALTLEWQRSSVRDPRLWMPSLLLAFGLAGGARVLARYLPFLGLAVLGALLLLRFQRNSYEALLLAAPLVGVSAELLVEVCTRRGLTLLARALPLVLGLGLPGVHLALVPVGGFNPSFGVGVEARMIPTETLDVLRALPAGRTIHDCTLGGYLIWQRIPVYCDGRTVALYREPDLERLFLPLYQGEAALENVSDRYDIHYGLARRASDFERALMRSRRWVPIAYDREHALFVRRVHATGLPVPLLDELRYDPDPAWMRAWYDAAWSDPARRANLESALRIAVERYSASYTLHAIVVFLAAHRPELTEPFAL
jgi:hypothetical protein